MNKVSKALFVLPFVSAISISNVSAGENWDTTIGIQGSLGDYSNSTQRNDKDSLGLFVTADYLDSYGFTFIYDRSSYDYKQNIRTIDQDTFFLSGRKTFRPDALNGLLTLSLDTFHIDNDDRSKLTDNVKIYGTHLSYLTYDKKYYADLGYANSDYYKGLTIDQWTPTFGFGFNEQKDWLQIRGYFISSNKKIRTQGEKSTEAIDLSLTHYFDGQTLNLNKIKGSYLTGERMFTVDRDSAGVYNLSDIQKEGFSLLAEFQLTETVKLTVAGGKERFRNEDINDSYSSTYIYSGLSTSF
jgi:hypothetical protein